MQYRMQTQEHITKLRGSQRIPVMVAQSDKQHFDRHKCGLYDWQLFRRMVACYEQFGHLVPEEEAIAS